MKKHTILITLLAFLSLLAGYLFSKVSWIGGIGMSLFYKHYNFFKTWWKGTLLVFAILIILLALHWLAFKYLKEKTALIFYITGLLVAISGIYFTYLDFRADFSHRWLGERFHLGAYCFWIGWLSISVYFLAKKQIKPIDSSV